MSTTYPAQWESDVVLADGGTAHIRPVRTDDGMALVALHSRLSPESIHLRFMVQRSTMTPAEAATYTHVDYADRMALVAMLDGEMVAIASYDRVPGTDEAEVSFLVDDAHQGRGLGTITLEHLAIVARQHGITRFFAETLPHNRRMLGVFHDAGFADAAAYDEGVVRVTFPIEPTETSLAAAYERERQAAARSIQRIVRPRSIAVIGAGRERGDIGHEIFRNLLAAGFVGPLYPVHTTAAYVSSVPAYPSVLDIPNDVDLAVIAVRAAEVPKVIEQCGAKRVRSLVVVSAGFAETGPEGAAAERALVAQAAARGMRLLGPRCMGVVNASPDVRMNATLAPFDLVPGRVGFLSESGALGIAILEEHSRAGLGFSSFVSVGNRADVSSNDLLQYWEDDDATEVVLLYLESFGNPRTFSRVARRISRKKPLVAVKSGRTVSGGRAARLRIAGASDPEGVVEALFRQTGVIRVDNVGQLFDVARVLIHQPLPAGRRVAIVGNAGGPGILAADACEGYGLQVPELSAATQAELRSFLPPHAAVENPVDLMGTAEAGAYFRALRATLADPGIDAVIVIFVPLLDAQADDVAIAIRAAHDEAREKPILANFVATPEIPSAIRSGSCQVPTFPYPESPAPVLAHVASYAEWRRRPEGDVPEFSDVDPGAARLLVDTVIDEHTDGVWLDPASASELLDAYGVNVARTVHAATADDAVSAADAFGYPVVLKAGSGDIPHKTDVGAVHLGLESPAEVRAAFAATQAALGEAMGGAVVQVMVEPGVEAIIGMLVDPSFGPLVTFGLGGSGADLLGDRAFHILPLTDRDAHELVRSPRGAPLLFGYRGAPPADLDALEELLMRVGRLVDDIPEVAEVELSPVIVSAKAATAVDAKVRLAPWVPRPELALRRLR